MKSRVAVVGTLTEWPVDPAGYGQRELLEIVRGVQPDLLCAEIHPAAWTSGDLGGMAPEYGEDLVPLSRRTDIVIVPVADWKTRTRIQPQGGRFLRLRERLVGLLDAHLQWMQSGRRGLGALNAGMWGAICDTACSLTARLCGPEVRKEWDAANEALFENVMEAVRRDPECRVLVTVDCRRRHRLERRLGNEPELELVPYTRL